MATNQVNVRKHAQRAPLRLNSDSDNLQDSLHVAETETDTPFPRLENILVTAKQYPHTAIALMISIAALVVGAVVTLAISVIGGMFLMYGTMSQTTAKLDTVLKELSDAKTEQKVMRTYTASTLSRQNFMVGLLTRDQQKSISDYDKNNPINPPAEKDQ